jgi:hypothetical protein
VKYLCGEIYCGLRKISECFKTICMLLVYFFDAVGDSTNTASVVTTLPKWLFGRDLKGNGRTLFEVIPRRLSGDKGKVHPKTGHKGPVG